MMYIVKFEIRFFIILIWIDWYFENQTYNNFQDYSKAKHSRDMQYGN